MSINELQTSAPAGTPIKLSLYNDDNEVIQEYERSIVPWRMLKPALSLMENANLSNMADLSSLTEEDIDEITGLVVETFGSGLTVHDLDEWADIGEMVAVIQMIAAKANVQIGTPGKRIALNLYGADDKPIATHVRLFVPWKLLKIAVRLMKHLDQDHLTEADVDSIADLVVEVFGNKFTVKDIDDGADISEMMMAINAIISKATGPSNPTFPPGK